MDIELIVSRLRNLRATLTQSELDGTESFGPTSPVWEICDDVEAVIAWADRAGYWPRQALTAAELMAAEQADPLVTDPADLNDTEYTDHFEYGAVDDGNEVAVFVNRVRQY